MTILNYNIPYTITFSKEQELSKDEVTGFSFIRPTKPVYKTVYAESYYAARVAAREMTGLGRIYRIEVGQN